VYFADKGYLQITDYGASESLTKVYASSCRFGLPILHRGTVADSTVNMTVAAEWNNAISQNGEWLVDVADRRYATFVEAT
jgi:hypothetical protein